MMELSGLAAAFRRCVGELGMWSAANLFVSTARAQGGDQAVAELQGALGSKFPVLDWVATNPSPPDGSPGVLAACQGLRRLVVVGMEGDCLARLLDNLPLTTAVALLLDPTFPADTERLLAGWGDRVTLTDLASFQRFAGTRSALLTTIYGSDGFRAVVPRVWLRCHGDDVRTQFGRLIGWNVLGGAMESYPRWLVETGVADFTDIVGIP